MTTHELTVFEGKVEVGSELKITNTGDGLSAPLAAEPRAWSSGTKLPVLLFVDVKDITHRPAKEGVGWIRVHQAPADEGFVLDHVDPKLLADLVAAQREAVRIWELEQKRLKEEAKGQPSLAGLEQGGPVDGGPSWSEKALAGDGEPIDVKEVVDDGRPEGMSEAEWEASARSSSVSPIGAKRQSRRSGAK